MLQTTILGGIDEIAQSICDLRAAGRDDGTIRSLLALEHSAEDIATAFIRADALCAKKSLRTAYTTRDNIWIPAEAQVPGTESPSSRKKLYIGLGIGAGVLILGGIVYAMTRSGKGRR